MLILGLVLGLPKIPAQEVLSITWPTKHASPPVVFQKPASDFLPAFRFGLSILPESNVVSLAFSQPSFLGLSQQDATNLQSLFEKRYQSIQNDPVFREVASVLPYCYAERTPTQGLALVYRPRKLDTNTPCLVFLHGYGGSFLWSQQLLAEAFPGCLIICPAYGNSSALMPPAYLSECLDAVEQKLGGKIYRPTLIGLSAGGFGAARIFTQSPNRFVRLIVLAAYPPEETLAHFDKNMSVYFLVGARESYVQSGFFGRSMQSIRPRVAKLEVHTVPDADHFFLLAQRPETLKILRSWLETPTSPGAKN